MGIFPVAYRITSQQLTCHNRLTSCQVSQHVAITGNVLLNPPSNNHIITLSWLILSSNKVTNQPAKLTSIWCAKITGVLSQLPTSNHNFSLLQLKAVFLLHTQSSSSEMNRFSSSCSFHLTSLFSVKSVAQEQKNEIMSQLQTIRYLMKKRGMDCPPLNINGGPIDSLKSDFRNYYSHCCPSVIQSDSIGSVITDLQ